MRWFKFYGQDFLTDSRVGALHPLQKLMWVSLLCIASQDDARTGEIKFLTEDRLMDLCGITLEDLQVSGVKQHVTLETFCNMGLVSMPDENTLIVTNFYKKQTEQSTSTERVRDWRARKQAVSQEKKDVTHETNVMLQSNGRIEENRIDNTGVANAPRDIPIGMEEGRTKKVTPEMQQVFDLFKHNPARLVWKGRVHIRDAAKVLFDTFGIEELALRYRISQEHKGEDMCPQIDDPSEFLEKMPKMENFLKKL